MKPLIERLGNDFFLAAPREPGVYVMRGAGERILYIGQSKNLRTRLAFYKNANPDRMPRRLVRLVHQVEQISWERCQSAEAARLRELELLQLHRPRFNRADTGPQYFHFIDSRFEGIDWKIELHFEEPASPGQEHWLGPVKGRVIPMHALAALQRLWLGAARPLTRCADLPILPKRLTRVTLGTDGRFRALAESFIAGESAELVSALLAAQNPAAETVLKQLQESDAEILMSWARALSPQTTKMGASRQERSAG